jgi:hypothetical protein
MASYNYTFTSGDTITPQRLNDARTVSAIVNADIDAAAGIALSKLATGALPTAITVATANMVDGNVTLAKLVTAVQNALVPAGAVQAFARSTAPAGWLAANGNTIGNASSNATHAAATYEALFAVLWDNWTNTDLPILTSGGAASTRGADAATDFAANKRLPLPNLNGIFIRGSGSQAISGITYNKTFAAKEGDALQGHSHTISGHLLAGVGVIAGGAALSYVQATASGPITDGTNGTPRVASETRPANIALLYCIKF